ncbi:unnamed protein product [Urochloa humidicola]
MYEPGLWKVTRGPHVFPSQNKAVGRSNKTFIGNLKGKPNLLSSPYSANLDGSERTMEKEENLHRLSSLSSRGTSSTP